MKLNYIIQFTISLVTISFVAVGQCNETVFSDTTTYTMWCDEMNVPYGSENENNDGDIYINFEEYALGLDHTSADGYGVDHLTVSDNQGDALYPKIATFQLQEHRPVDVFYEIQRSFDAAEGNLYEDWEIAGSRWALDDWFVIDAFKIEEEKNSNGWLIKVYIPAQYQNNAFRCVATNVKAYPAFSWDHVLSWCSARRPNINQDGFEEFTDADHRFIAKTGHNHGNGIVDITIGESEARKNELRDVLKYNPDFKTEGYTNGAIVTTPNQATFGDLSPEDYAVKLDNGEFLLSGSTDRYYVDYRIPLGAQRKKDIVTALIDSGNNGMFIDAIRKTAGAVSNITGDENKKAYLEAYFDFLTHVKQSARGGTRTLNLYPFDSNTPNYTGYAFTDDLYQSDEALMNAYFNGLYSERWLLFPTPDELINRLDWFINRWTGHGKLWANNIKAVTPHSEENVFDLAINMIVMGRNSRFRFFDDNADFRYELGGWKNPTYWANLADLKLGRPFSNAKREGYVYSRRFEFCEVEVDVSKRTAIIRWLNDDGTLLEQWPTDQKKNGNAKLAAITWPDMPQQMGEWKGDTIPGFSSDMTDYLIGLPSDIKSIPVLTAIPQNANAQIEQQSATSLTGTEEERTTTFSVTSEDHLNVTEYHVTFFYPNEMQPYGGEPFISEVVTNNRSWMSFVEVVNPNSVPCDFSGYLFLKSNSTNDPVSALQQLIPENPTSDDYYSRYNAYIPGYKFYDDSAAWFANPGKVIPDIDVNPFVTEGDVFVFGSCAYNRSEFLAEENYPDKLWETLGEIGALNENNVFLGETFSMVKRNAEALFVYKIMNDEILDGTKAIGDPADYELVDILANGTLNGSWNIAGNNIVSNSRVALRRKPQIHDGVSTAGEGFGTNATDSDWIVLLEENLTDLGRHDMDSITGFRSTVTSSVYLVSRGYLSPQTIQGNLSETALSEFFENIQKADISQTLTMLSHNDGSTLNLSDNVSEGDTLLVVASNGAQTRYVLINEPVSSDALLTSSTLNIDVNNQSGTIAGMFFGDTLRNVIEMLNIPSFATMKVVDKNGVLVPMRQMNMMGEYTETSVTDNICFEVTAQDNITKILYQLHPSIPANGALIISDVYKINHDSLTISGLISVTGTELLYRSIQTFESASIQVVNGDSTEYTSVVVGPECLIKVTAKDGTIQYYELKFIDDQSPTVTCPNPAESYDADAGERYATLSFAATTENNIGVSSTVYSVGGTPISFPYEFAEGITTVDVLVTDFNNNTATCSFDVTVNERKAVVFMISEESMGNPLPDISVTLGDIELITNINGTATVNLNSGEYSYTISHTDYFSYSSSFELTNDTTIRVSLVSKTSDIKFMVYSEDAPLPDVLLKLDGDSLLTSPVGIAQFNDLTRYEEYEWSASKVGFEDITGMMNLTNDSTVNVYMTPLASISESYQTKSLRIYPNPVHSFFNIKSENKLQKIEICDLRGAVLREYFVKDTEATIAMSSYPDGLYIVKIYKEGQKTENIKLIKEHY